MSSTIAAVIALIISAVARQAANAASSLLVTITTSGKPDSL